MAVTTFHDFPLAPRDREWDGAAAEKRVRAWADAQDKPTPRYRDAHIWYDAGSKQNFTAYKLLFTDIANGRQVAVPRAIMAAGNIMQGSRGGIDLPEPDITQVKNHLAKYYKKMGETCPLMLTAELENHHLLGDAGFRDGRRHQLARDLGGPAEFVLPGLGALVVALLLFTGLRGSRRVRTA